LTGDSVRFLSLLGDSVSTVALENEVDFIDLMPGFMRDTIFKQIYEVYNNKFNFFNDEQLEFFVEFLRHSNFRRSIVEEQIDHTRGSICIVYSGQVGLQIPHLR